MPKTATTATKEIVILLWKEGEIIGMVRGNGTIKYFECKEMSMMKHEALWGVDGATVPESGKGH